MHTVREKREWRRERRPKSRLFSPLCSLFSLLFSGRGNPCTQSVYEVRGEFGTLMAERVRCPWLARLLFRLTVGTSLLLLLLVLFAPLLDNGTPPLDGWRRVVALFAQDTTLRRTAIASALGM